MPIINGKFYTGKEVSDIYHYRERDLWEEVIEGALIIIEDESDDEGFKRYLDKNWDMIIKILAPEIPDVYSAMMRYSAENGLALHILIEEKVRERFRIGVGNK